MEEGKTQEEKDADAKLKKESDELVENAKTESELVKMEEGKVEEIDTMEEEEERMK